MTPLCCQLTDRDRVRLSFRSRGLTLQKLAAKLGQTSHVHLSKVLNNVPHYGKETRPKLFPHLTTEDIRLLGWTPQYDAWRSTQNNVPTPTTNEGKQ